MEDDARVITWFSCGAASAMAAKLAIEKYGERAVVVYCDTMASEHPDNQRFFSDVERWTGRSILKIKSEKYASVEEVFEKRRYMAGIAGAICTTEMKKIPRFRFQRPDDVHIFGFTIEEQHRIRDFEHNNPELSVDWILRDQGIGKKQCLRIIEEAGIQIPAMYLLGFETNNCIGCVKATSPTYWQRVRRHFPEIFWRLARQSRELGVRLVRVNGKRIYLDELPADTESTLWARIEIVNEDLSCGPQCATA